MLKNFNIRKCEQQPFHIVDPSPWPFFLSWNLLSNVLGFVMYFNFFSISLFQIFFNFLVFSFILYSWFNDIVIESTFEGHHTLKVQRGIKMGMVLFIISEVMFFFSFFWAYFHYSLCPSIFIGGVWPPVGIYTLDPWGLPLTNTIILLSSGVSITYSHRAICYGNRVQTSLSLIFTIFLGSLFTYCQYFEYNSATFSINDGVYGSIFYLATGFHGFHVLVGTLFLFICLIRHYKYHFTKNCHVGYECAIWYFHFVDVVWIFLFITVYDISNYF
jgi:cytochrome c oxidase subunit 3